MDLVKDIEQNFERYDFGLKTYAMEIGLILEKSQEFQVSKEFQRKFCREFEQTNVQDI